MTKQEKILKLVAEINRLLLNYNSMIHDKENFSDEECFEQKKEIDVLDEKLKKLRG
jgi:hypothetical protein